jgi:NitT/TauT family transport system substrate-binding protein
MDEAKMCQSVDLVNNYMGVANKVGCNSVFTNEFLTKVDLPVAVN